VLKLADEPKPTPPPPPPKPFVDDDDEDDASVKKGYGVVAETEEEKAKAEENKPSFGEIQDKHKKSARGPAMALLVMPTNLLTLEGLLTGIGGLLLFLVGMWPLVFNDAPPGEEETQEAIVYMMLGLVTLFWGAMVCFGASQMQELASLPWAMIGAVMGVVPLLVGIYAIVMLQNPEVKAGFAETDGGADEDEEEDDDDEEDEEEDKKKKKGKGAKKVSKKASEDDDE
jgi:cadmium resistance protein CadD (predicted permease)